VAAVTTGSEGPTARSVGRAGLVVVVEDEPAIADVERLYLTRDGFGVHTERDGTAGLAAVRRLRPVAVVLDVGLPGLDGIEICRALRAAGDRTPLLFVTARSEEVDRVVGLELGADNYLTKPFSPRELVARVRAVLRRSAGDALASTPPAALVVGGVTIDPAGRRVTVRAPGGEVTEPALTVTEFDLLAELTRHRGQVLTRDQLLSRVWGYESAAGARTVDVHLAALRAKLGPGAGIVRTVRGVGYAVEEPRGAGGLR